jgi:hypothetical protein
MPKTILIRSARDFVPAIQHLPEDEKLDAILRFDPIEPGPHQRYIQAMDDMDSAKGKADYQRKVDAFFDAEKDLFRNPSTSQARTIEPLQDIAKLGKAKTLSITIRGDNRGIHQCIKIMCPNWKPGSQKRELAEKVTHKLAQIAISQGHDAVIYFQGKYKKAV